MSNSEYNLFELLICKILSEPDYLKSNDIKIRQKDHVNNMNYMNIFNSSTEFIDTNSQKEEKNDSSFKNVSKQNDAGQFSINKITNNEKHISSNIDAKIFSNQNNGNISELTLRNNNFKLGLNICDRVADIFIQSHVIRKKLNVDEFVRKIRFFMKDWIGLECKFINQQKGEWILELSGWFEKYNYKSNLNKPETYAFKSELTKLMLGILCKMAEYLTENVIVCTYDEKDTKMHFRFSENILQSQMEINFI